jgi:nitrogen regulatory protein P-II 1
MLVQEDAMMTKIEAIIQPGKLEALKTALIELGAQGMTIFEVRGHGRQKGHTEVYRGQEYVVDLLPKIKVEIVVPDHLAETTVQTIVRTTATGKIGDGKIFLSSINDAVRIRNQERGTAAL